MTLDEEFQVLGIQAICEAIKQSHILEYDGSAFRARFASRCLACGSRTRMIDGFCSRFWCRKKAKEALNELSTEPVGQIQT